MAQYEALFTLGTGGLGQVTLCVRRDGRFERLFAVKRLRAVHAEDSEIRAMFEEEGRIAGLLSGRYTVPVIDAGEDERGPYIVMEYLDGIDLRVAMRELASQLALPLPLRVAATIGAQTARALDALHNLKDNHGVALSTVHRDVSPQNILLGFDGQVRLTDVGIAKASGSAATETRTGVLKGKPGYFAPEQLRFEEVTDRTDIFALGVVLFEMLTGRRLFPSNCETDFRRVLDEPPPDLHDYEPGAPAKVVDLLVRMLASNPALRPSAREVAGELEELAANEPDEDSLNQLIANSFGTWRSERAERIRIALEELDAPKPAPKEELDQVAQDHAPRVDYWRIAAFAMALLAAVALAYSFGRRDTQPPPTVEARAVVEGATDARQTATTSEQTEAQRGQRTQPSDETPEVDTAPSESTPATTQTRRRRRRRPTPMGNKVELMDWAP